MATGCDGELQECRELRWGGKERDSRRKEKGGQGRGREGDCDGVRDVRPVGRGRIGRGAAAGIITDKDKIVCLNFQPYFSIFLLFYGIL